jgi:hypothetical protein
MWIGANEGLGGEGEKVHEAVHLRYLNLCPLLPSIRKVICLCCNAHQTSLSLSDLHQSSLMFALKLNIPFEGMLHTWAQNRLTCTFAALADYFFSFIFYFNVAFYFGSWKSSRTQTCRLLVIRTNILVRLDRHASVGRFLILLLLRLVAWKARKYGQAMCSLMNINTLQRLQIFYFHSLSRY